MTNTKAHSVNGHSPLRILWWSNAPWCQSGYGVQTELITAELQRRGHEVHIVCNFGLSGSSSPCPDGRIVYPSSIGRGDNWGEKAVQHVAHYVRPDVIVTLYDVWTLSKDFWAGLSKDFKVLNWVPVEHVNLMDKQREFYEATSCIPVPMSYHGQRELMRESIQPQNVIWHAVHPEYLKVGDSWSLRAGLNIEEEAFVVGIVAANHDTTYPRKGWNAMLEGFHLFNHENPGSYLYLHTDPKNGMDLERMARKIGMNISKMFTASEASLYFGTPAAAMRDKYAAFDVLLATSLGEGFGIPVIEAQAQGTPVIVNNATSQPELVSHGHIVTSGFDYWDEQVGAYYRHPNPEEIAEKLDIVYNNPMDGSAGLKFIEDNFQVGKITDQWEEVLYGSHV